MNKWDKRFMDLAFEISKWSSCYKPNRQVGAVIVSDKRVLSTGYNGAPSGIFSCNEKSECIRNKMGIASGTHHEICYAIHAEQNAIVGAAKNGVAINGSTLYCTHQPCVICTKMIINAGIKRVIYKEPYPDEFALELLNMADVVLEKYDDLN